MIATLVAAIFTTNWYIFDPPQESSETWWNTFSLEWPYWTLWGVFVPVIVRLDRRLSQVKMLPLLRWLAYPAVGLLVVCLHKLAVTVIWWLTNPSAFDPPAPFLLEAVQSRLFRNLPQGVMCLAIIFVSHRALEYYRQYREKEVKAAQLEAQLVQAQLQALRMQLQPHFLFNTLHSISALLHENLDAADEMIARLGELLRFTLETSGAQFTPLAQELEMLRHYLAIQSIRFQDRLTVKMTVAPETLAAQVPNLILQPIVENAIKHGIATRLQGGEIHLRAQRENGVLRLQVQDSGPGLAGVDEPLRDGVGLQNTRRRLHELYGPHAALRLENAPAGGLIVSMEIPFESRSSHDEQHSG